MEYSYKFQKSTIKSAPVVGSLMMFKYKAVTAEKHYYDKTPLCYVVFDANNTFYGMNLHYYPPDARMGVVTMLQEAQQAGVKDWDKFLFGSVGFHKYLKSEVMSNYLDVDMEEWETAIYLPVESFVRSLRGAEFPVSARRVW